MNPRHSQATHTTVRSAIRHVARGIARWEGDAKRLIADDNRVGRATLLADHAKRAAELGYDCVNRPLTKRELQALPFVGNVDRLLVRA